METLKPVPDVTSEQRSWAKPIARVRLAAENEAVERRSYQGHHLYEVAGNNVTFKDCDFSFSVIERCYFRSAVFENCKFVGAKILDSSFRSGSFSNCDFQYAIIQRCNLPVEEV